MHAYLIDPENRTVEITDVGDAGNNIDKNFGDLARDYIKPERGGLDAARINDHRDYVWVADFAFTGPQCIAYRIDGCIHPLAGRSVIIGCGEFGETQSPEVSVDWLRENIQWLGLKNCRVDQFESVGPHGEFRVELKVVLEPVANH
ncbi:MAG: hypothetical protein Q7N50_13660 [Armatimonadota bacterium]|nr:hypothetical protein [Armatimonadota bacterium]